MELRHLRYFVAVAEHQHFGRAAEALGTAQPSLSNQIRQLEAELGTALFERTTRRVRLTPAGETFLEESRRLLAGLEAGIERTREVATGMRGRLRFAYVSGSMRNLLPRIIAGFEDAYPHVALHVQSMMTEQQVDALRDGSIDVGLFASGFRAEDFGTSYGWRERLILAIPAGDPLARKRSLRYDDLDGRPLVVYARTSGSAMQDNILDILHRRNISATITYQGTEAETIVGLVAARRGLALVPGTWSTFALDGVVYRPILPAQYLRGLSFYWMRERGDPLVRAFVESAVKTIGGQEPN